MKIAAIICGLGRTHERGIYLGFEKKGCIEIITDQRDTAKKKRPRPTTQQPRVDRPAPAIRRAMGQ